MKFACDRCGKRYSSTDDPVPGKLYRIPCKCGHVILVRGNASGGVTPASPVNTPAPSTAAPRPPPPAFAPGSAAPRPSPAPAPAAPGVGGDVPQFDGDPFAASVAPPAHPAATSAADLGLPGAVAAGPPAPARRDPGIRLEDPTPPSVRQPFPEPRPFAGPDGELDLEPLAGGAPAAPGHSEPEDPFAGLAATLGDGGLAPPPPSPAPTFHRPAAVAPPPFARVDRGAAEHAGRRAPQGRRGRGVFLAALSLLVVAGAVGAWFFIVSMGSTSTTTATVNADPARPPRAARPARRPEPKPPAPPPETPAPGPPAAAPLAEQAAPAEPPRAAKPAAERSAPRQRTQQRTPAPPPAPVAEAPGAEAPAAAPPPPDAAPAAAPKRTLQPEDVIAVVRARRGEFDACIARAVESKTPGNWLGRRVELLVFVSPSGRVSSAAVDDAEVEPTELGACLRLVARRMTFPAFQGEAVPLSLPLRLGKAE